MTSKRSQPTSSSYAARIALSAAALLCAGLAFGNYTALARQAHQTQDTKALAQIVRSSGLAANDPSVRQALKQLESSRDAQQRSNAAARLIGAIDLRAMSETAIAPDNAGQMARQIKASGLYRDPGLEESSNWLGKAIERILNLLRRRQGRPPNLNIGGFGPFVTYLMWGLLIAAVAVFAFLAIRHYSWRNKLSRKAAAVMEEDEPERTADEWLAEADRLEAAGDFRRAVRCLYLACLLRFDEANVARFDRGQTNWEHLVRIQASPRLPEGLDFQPATKAFDRIWYGKMVRGHEDVDLFRGYYGDVKASVSAVPA